MDPCSYSNYDFIRTTAMAFDWSINFEKKVIGGSVEIECKIIKDGAKELILDSQHLKIEKIKIDGITCEFKYGEAMKSKALGKPLIIQIQNTYKISEILKVEIFYETTENCTALQWLTNQQTIGGIHPYLFSQCKFYKNRIFLHSVKNTD
jgi:leukotriene-A4 hydrolase